MMCAVRIQTFRPIFLYFDLIGFVGSDEVRKREYTAANHRIFIRAVIPQPNIPKYDMCTSIVTYFKWG